MTQTANPMTYDDVLSFWFGRVEETLIPSAHRARIWFNDSPEIDALIRSEFSAWMTALCAGEYDHWREIPRGALASVVAYDQFSRHLYRGTAQAYAYDETALDLTLSGMAAGFDHELSLIERVFFYFPLLHSENLTHQAQAIGAYAGLVAVSFPETRALYDSFYQFAQYHYGLIEEFGRFPIRNEALGRVSTQAEIAYLDRLVAEKE